MSKPVGFRCPDDILLEIEKNVRLTGLNKTDVIVEMLQGLPGIDINDRKKLPEIEAIYLVWTKNELVYVGQATNIKEQFSSHHRLIEFLDAEARISWFSTSKCSRLEVEQKLVNILNPVLNQDSIGSIDKTKDNKVLKNIDITNELWIDIDRIAISIGVTESEAIEILIRKAISKHQISGIGLTALDNIINSTLDY